MFTPYSVQTDSAIQTRLQFQPIPNPLTLSLLVVMLSSLLGVMAIRPVSTLLKHSGRSVPVPGVSRMMKGRFDDAAPELGASPIHTKPNRSGRTTKSSIIFRIELGKRWESIRKVNAFGLALQFEILF